MGRNYHHYNDYNDYDTPEEENYNLITKHNWSLINSYISDEIIDTIIYYSKKDSRLSYLSICDIIKNYVPNRIKVHRTGKYLPFELKYDEDIRDCILRIEEILRNYKNKYIPTDEFLENYYEFLDEKERKKHVNINIDENKKKKENNEDMFNEYTYYVNTYFHENMDRNSIYKRVSNHLKNY